jgi:hypothetical protein
MQQVSKTGHFKILPMVWTSMGNTKKIEWRSIDLKLQQQQDGVSDGINSTISHIIHLQQAYLQH